MAKKKKPIIKEVKKDNTINMVILGAVAILSIVGLVLLFSAATNAGLATFYSTPPKLYGGALQGADKFKIEQALVKKSLLSTSPLESSKMLTDVYKQSQRVLQVI